MSFGRATVLRSIKGMPPKQWQEWRQGLRSIGSSDAGAMLGLSRYGSPYQLAGRLTGRIPPPETTIPMTIGTRLEPRIRDFSARTTGLPIEPVDVVLRHPRLEMVHACLDGWTGRAPTEFKFGGWRQRDHWQALAETGDLDEVKDSELPAYAAQVQVGMSVTDADHGHLCAVVGEEAGLRLALGIDPDERDFFHILLERDEEFIRRFEAAAEEFWRRFVIGNEIPEPSDIDDGAVAATYPNEDPGKHVELPAYVGLAAEYDEARAEAKLAEARKKKAANLLKEVIGTAESAVCGPYKVTWKTTARGSRTLNVRRS